MISHIVFLKIKKSISESETLEFYDGLSKLKDIPGVVMLHYGKHDSDMYKGYVNRSKGFTHALVVILKDSHALAEYDSNALHQEIKKKYILPNLDNDSTDGPPVVAMDYEINQPTRPLETPINFVLGATKVLSLITAEKKKKKSRL